MRILALVLTIATGLMWATFLMPDSRKLEDRVCPSKQVRVRYPASMADYHDQDGYYRIAYCKPTGIVWARTRG